MNQEYLKNILSYNTSSGEMFWRENRRSVKKGDVAGYKNLKGYRIIRIDGKNQQAHKIAWVITYGTIPDDCEIDHINHVKDDNRLCNLRSVVHSVNVKNKPKQLNNKSGMSGVRYRKDRSKWEVLANTSGKRIYIGRFDSQEEAFSARLTANSIYGYHDNHGV